MTNAISRRIALALLAAPLLLSTAAFAQDKYPTKAIKLVVPFAAGGSTDIVARIVSQRMSELLGEQVVVDNRGGAGGNLGADIVAKSAPDGYTLLLATVATHALNPALYPKMPYDPVKDFTPISLLATIPNVLVVHPSLKVKTVKELIALLKANPGKYSYASSGNGSPLHLSGELFKSMAGVDMEHIPYRGAGPALIDVTSGQVPIFFDNLPSSIGYIKQGVLIGLGVTSAKRSTAMPDLVTISESGLPGYETYSWNALFGPAGVSPAIVAKLNTVANQAVKDTSAKLIELSAEPVGSTPEALAETVKSELAKWAPIVKASGAKID